MPKLKLVIGDKNLSSWSLRPWILMKHAGIDFEEIKVLLDRPESKANIRAHSPSGLVPCLIDGDTAVWDSLAIMGYLNDRFPEKQLWPADIKTRGHARSAAAEMHSGFSALRTVWPMLFTRRDLDLISAGGVTRDVARINELWTDARKAYSSGTHEKGGPFLFGGFSIADAMYAPVVSRFATYGPVDLSPEARAYAETMMGLPAMVEWGQGAIKEVQENG